MRIVRRSSWRCRRFQRPPKVRERNFASVPVRGDARGAEEFAVRTPVSKHSNGSIEAESVVAAVGAFRSSGNPQTLDYTVPPAGAAGSARGRRDRPFQDGAGSTRPLALSD